MLTGRQRTVNYSSSSAKQQQQQQQQQEQRQASIQALMQMWLLSVGYSVKRYKHNATVTPASDKVRASALHTIAHSSSI
jgi:hypothetical protein